MSRQLAMLSMLLFLRPATAQVDTQNAMPGDAATRIAWLKANAVAVRSIDPKDEDFSDLAPLKKAIGDSRVVMLGEQSHGDGSTFKAKSRLVKFLHQEMGFDVLCFESGLFDCLAVERAYLAGEPAESAWEHGVFGIWSLSKEALPALVYARDSHATARPLEIAGLDSQFTSGEGPKQLPAFIGAFFDKADAAILTQRSRDDLADTCAWMGSLSPETSKSMPVSVGGIHALVALLETNRGALEKAHGPAEVALIECILRNVIAYAEQIVAGPDAGQESANTRDEAMGRTLEFLAKVRYADRRIIVWAASMHLARNAPAIKLQDGPSYAGLRTMGQVAWEALGEQIYSVMFTAAGGTAGLAWGQDWEIEEPVPASLEDLLDRTGPDYLFVDLRAARAAGPGGPGAWLTEQNLARPLGYAWATADWTGSFDAIFYTETMVRSRHARR